MKFSLKESFGALTRFEWALWGVSLVVVMASFLLCPEPDYLTLGTSLIGVTALIFIAKGMLLGQILTLVFSTLYGFISYHYAYYGEVLTYVGMTAPMAIIALVSWARHPYKESAEVEVARITGRQIVTLTLLTIAVTVLFYFILRALGTANLLTSTLSVTTSFLAVYLTYLRSPYYAIGYSANDIVLIVLWILATIDNPAYLPMVFCFVMFLTNDIYGFINWRRMQRRQQEDQ